MCHFVSYTIVSENYSVQNSPCGGWEGGLWPAQGLQCLFSGKYEKDIVNLSSTE